MKTIWTIAGSDSSGAAGVQADIKTISALGAHACSLVTSVTAQNSYHFDSLEAVSLDLLKAQWHALSNDLTPQAVKIGLIPNREILNFVAAKLSEITVPKICDPVFQTSSEQRLQGAEIFDDYVRKIVLNCDALTPNLAESERITGNKVESVDDMKGSAAKLKFIGARSFYLKGGHLNSEAAVDYCVTKDHSFWLRSSRLDLKKTRGTGCSLSSAVAAALALGHCYEDAFVLAKIYVHRALRKSFLTSNGISILQHGTDFSPEDMPQLFPRDIKTFQHPEEEPIGFYPIVERAHQVEELYRLGVSVLQLRIKDLYGQALETEIERSVKLAKDFQRRIYINDYWELALKYGAYGIHLGQEDIEAADIKKICDSKTRLGISTHSFSELARALPLGPSYIALGPIFPTTIKSMRFAPQGLDNLKMWRSLVRLPLVAIGGITLEKTPELIQAGADGISVISDLRHAKDLAGRVSDWLKITASNKKGPT